MTELHPLFAARDTALTAYLWARGVVLGDTSVCRSLSTQIRLRREKGALAADPYAVGPISPWGWRSYSSLHVEQVDGYCHAKDYTIAARAGFPEARWSVVHEVARGFGIVFPLAARSHLPEPWHGQTWTASSSGGLRDAPMMRELLGTITPDSPPFHRSDPPLPPVPLPPTHHAEAEPMYESRGLARPGTPNVIDFVNLPADGQILDVRNRSMIYVKRAIPAQSPTHARVFANGRPLGPEAGAADGLFFLPEDGRPIAITVTEEGYWSVEGYDAGTPSVFPVAVAQAQSWFTG